MYNHLRIIKLLTIAEFRKQLKERKAGFLWLILEPLFLISIFVLFLGEVLKKSNFEGPFSVVILVGLISWQTFSRAVFSGCNYQEKYRFLIPDFINNRFLLVLPLVIYSHMYLIAALLLLFPMSLYYGNSVHLPYMFLSFILQVLCCGIITSSLGYVFIRFKDIKPIAGIVLRGMWFLSPILYTTESFIEHVPHEYIKMLFFLNPMVLCIDLYRASIGFDVIIHSYAVGGYVFTLLLFILILFIIQFKVIVKNKINNELKSRIKLKLGSEYFVYKDGVPNEIRNFLKPNIAERCGFIVYNPHLRLIPELNFYENLMLFYSCKGILINNLESVKVKIDDVHKLNWNKLIKKTTKSDVQVFRQMIQLAAAEHKPMLWYEPRVYADGAIKQKIIDYVKETSSSYNSYVFISRNEVFYFDSNLSSNKVNVCYG